MAQPIKFQELCNLASLGFPQTCFNFSSLSIESEKYVCVRERNPQGAVQSVAMIPTANPSAMNKKPIPVDFAIMHPTRNVFAFATKNGGATVIQVLDMDSKTKLKELNFNGDIIFWAWIDEQIIGIVTANSVFHLDISSQQQPVKIMDRVADLGDCQIVGYCANRKHTWAALIGLAKRNNAVVGQIQLHSTERNMSQTIEGFAACFTPFVAEGATQPSTLFVFAQRTPAGQGKLFILEVEKGDAPAPLNKVAVDVPFPADAAQDFPVSVQCNPTVDATFMVTKMGYLYVFYTGNGTLVYRNRVSNNSIFEGAKTATNGIVVVNNAGQVLSINVDENNLVPYCLSVLKNTEVGVRFAAKGLPGADALFEAKFRQLMSVGQVREAAIIASKCQSDAIRGQATINALKNLPAVNGQPALLLYFSGIIESGKLNAIESLELARLVISQGKGALLEKYLVAEKLTPSEQLGDLCKSAGESKLATAIYSKANCATKVMASLAEAGQFDKIAAYSQTVGVSADYMSILQGMVPMNPEGACTFVKQLIAGPERDKLDINAVVNLFLRTNQIKQVTALLIEYLKGDRPHDAELQTKLLEINLRSFPQVADAILGQKMFSHFDKKRVGGLCEAAQLHQRALELYTDIKDIRRVIVNTHNIPVEFLVEFFGRLSADDTITCLGDLLRANMRQNCQHVVAVATKYYQQVGADKLIPLFEQFKCYDGLFFFLGGIVGTSQDPLVHYKYIEAAARVGNIEEVSRACRESDYYDPAKVRDFLKEAKLPDQLPLIIVCDRFDFVPDLVKYLYQSQLSKFIEAYVQRINPGNTHLVCGALLDCGCNEDYVKKLVFSVGNQAKAEDLVEAFETRNRLKLLLPWLEQRLNEGNQDAPVHSALAKIYVDMGKEPEEFLKSNQYYDHTVVGKYCEDRDPYLAYVAYKEGKCDIELINVTNKHNLFKFQATYLVERMSPELWASVLVPENQYKQSVVDQVIQTVLPECTNSEEVTVTVKAFMAANMPNELLELLDKLVLEGKEFAHNPTLQNLLILTAVKADQKRVITYIERLVDYVPTEVAQMCMSASLFEEAFAVYKKAKMHIEATNVLVSNIVDLQRATEYASLVQLPEVYSIVGKARLDAHQMKEAIDCFVKAKNTEYYPEVIAQSTECQNFEDLITFLLMCREQEVKDSRVETELLFAYAKTDKLAELEEFITSPNSAQIQVVADRCFEGEMYEAARILYANISNYVRLTSTLIKLAKYADAIEAARKANSTKTWFEVCVACADAGEFKLAQAAGLNIIIHGDELSTLIKHYETKGFFDEAIALLEAGLGLERAHIGMFTELAVLYSKYKEEKLMEHIKAYRGRMQMNKVVRVVRDNQQWKELVQLYITEHPDQAVETMIEHGPDCWENALFKEASTRLVKMDIAYKGVEFYLKQHPKLINEYLSVIAPRADHTIVVERVKRLGLIDLIKPYLVEVQDANNLAVNEALNALLVEEGECEQLEKSIRTYDNYDHLALAAVLEKHPRLCFRRIAIASYSNAKMFDKAIELAKKDKMDGDAISAAALSKSQKTAEDLLVYFVANKNNAAFVACLYACVGLLRPDVVMELSWKNGLTDLSMPFMIQTVRTQTTLLASLEERISKLELADKKRNEREDQEMTAPMPMMGQNVLSIMPAPGMMDGGMGMGMNMNMGMNMGM